MRSFYRRAPMLAALLLLALCLVPLRPQQTVAATLARTASATVETAPVPHSGDSADDPTIWVNPSDPSLSTILGTDKHGGLAVYDLAGRQLQYRADGDINNVDLRSGFSLGGHSITLVTANNRSTSSLAIYQIDPASRQLQPIAARTIATDGDAGVCMYHSAANGRFYTFLNGEDGTVEQWELVPTDSAKVDTHLVRQFDVGSETEGCVVDDARGVLYIAEEDVGIWRYAAAPDATTARFSVDTVGNHLVADIEGLAIANTGGASGYLIASSQGDSAYAVYRREGDNAYLGRFSIVDGGGVDGVSHTDGIDVTTTALGAAFPHGVFVAQDDANPGGNQNFKLVPFERILPLAEDPPAPPPTVPPSTRPTRTPSPSGCDPITPVTVTASGDDGNVPDNVLDGDMDTRWSDQGVGAWIQLDLGSARPVCSLAIAWYQGDERANHFQLQLSAEGNTFTTILAADSSGTSRALETYRFPTTSARFVRVVVNGNTRNDWASISELRMNDGSGVPPPPATPPPATPPPTTQPPTTPTPTGRMRGLWTSAAELAHLPMSGDAWNRLKAAADGELGTANIADQNSQHDTNTLAAALVYARTGEARYRAKAATSIMSALGTERGGRTLALGRNLVSYVIAADLIDLHSYDANTDGRFRTWLAAVRTESLDGRTLISTHEERPNNWGTHAGASRVAADLYLGDRADLARAALVFKGWLGDRSAYAGFAYGELSWQADPSKPVGINPKGAMKDGHSIDGVVPDDQRRAGSFRWPPPQENYVWEGLQGAVVQAELLHRAGYDAWHWSDNALLRAVTWETEVANFPARGDDSWQIWLVNHAYGTHFPTSPAQTGKNMGWTDWLYPR